MRLIRGLAVATASMLVVNTAQAQLNIAQFTVTSQQVVTGPNITNYAGLSGGGFNFTSSLSFQEYLAFCIDPTRTFAYNTTYTNYKLYNFSQFVAAALAPNAVNVTDLNYIANRVEAYTINPGVLPTPQSAANDAVQKAIWDTYTGVANGSGQMPSGNWGVLANGVNQTFLVRLADPNIVVPEPSTYALMAVGLVGLFAATRRRRLPG